MDKVNRIIQLELEEKYSCALDSEVGKIIEDTIEIYKKINKDEDMYKDKWKGMI